MPSNAALETIKPQDGSVLPIGELMERIIAAGDISQLAAGDRAHYLVRVAESSGLNPLSQPFDLIPKQGGGLVVYANKKATDQLRKIYGLNSRIVSRETIEGVYVVEVEVSDGHRAETNIGAVPVKGLQGELLANALMKTFTKAKRRATLDFCGLGILDESEIEGMQAAAEQRQRPEPTVRVLPNETVNRETGEITATPPARRQTMAGRIRELFAELEMSDDLILSFFETEFGVSTLGKLTPEQGKAAITMLERALGVLLDDGPDPDADDVQDAEFAPLGMDGMPDPDPDPNKYLG